MAHEQIEFVVWTCDRCKSAEQHTPEQGQPARWFCFMLGGFTYELCPGCRGMLDDFLAGRKVEARMTGEQNLHAVIHGDDIEITRYSLSILEVCEVLHMANTGSFEGLAPKAYGILHEFLKGRLVHWSEGPRPCNYDNAVKALVKATLEEVPL